MKVNNANIETEEEPKFAKIGDYWDNLAMGKFTDLIHEFQDLFLTKFSKMKGISDDLGGMNIPLKPNIKLVKQQP